MKINRMCRSALLLIAIFFFSSFDNLTSGNDPVVSAAQKGLPDYLALIPAGREALYGFPSQDDMKNCSVGKPYQLLKLSKDLYYGTYEEGKSYLVTGNEWRVPVVSNGESRTLLTVTASKGNYSVVDMGGALLSRELQQISAKADGNDNFYILRIYPLTADIFVDAKTASFSDAAFFPLTSAIIAMPSLANRSYTLNELLPIIKAALDKQPKN
jgi:hypothetical protein